MVMGLKKIADIYKGMILAIDKIEQRNIINRPSLIYPLDTQELIFEANSVVDDFQALEKEIRLMKSQVMKDKKNIPYEAVLSVINSLNDCLSRLAQMIEGSMNLIYKALQSLFYLNDYEISIHSSKVAFFSKDSTTILFKSIIEILQNIALTVLKKPLISGDLIMQKIQKAEADINLLFEGILIAKNQRNFSYYDIVLIITRFQNGLVQLSFLLREISDMTSELGNLICDQYELAMVQKQD
jgi:hypothetical protein